jgi:hypothetical protein
MDTINAEIKAFHTDPVNIAGNPIGTGVPSLLIPEEQTELLVPCTENIGPELYPL